MSFIVISSDKSIEMLKGVRNNIIAQGFSVAGDHAGQMSHGMRWPYGGVAVVTPFNFPLEIPVLQLMGALYMGNRPLLKVASTVSVVMEQKLRLLHACALTFVSHAPSPPRLVPSRSCPWLRSLSTCRAQTQIPAAD